MRTARGRNPLAVRYASLSRELLRALEERSQKLAAKLVNRLVAAAAGIAATTVVVEQRRKAERAALRGAARRRLARHFLLDRPADHAGRRHGLFDRDALGHRPLG